MGCVPSAAVLEVSRRILYWEIDYVLLIANLIILCLSAGYLVAGYLVAGYWVAGSYLVAGYRSWLHRGYQR